MSEILRLLLIYREKGYSQFSSYIQFPCVHALSVTNIEGICFSIAPDYQ